MAVGCASKGDDSGDPSPIVGTWLTTTVESSDDGGASWVVDEESCVNGNVEEFERDGDWTLYAGAPYCDTSVGSLTGTWRLEASGTILVLTYDAYAGEYIHSVDELTADTLTISYDSDTQEGTVIRLSYSRAAE